MVRPRSGSVWDDEPDVATLPTGELAAVRRDLLDATLLFARPPYDQVEEIALPGPSSLATDDAGRLIVVSALPGGMMETRRWAADSGWSEPEPWGTPVPDAPASARWFEGERFHLLATADGGVIAHTWPGRIAGERAGEIRLVAGAADGTSHGLRRFSHKLQARVRIGDEWIFQLQTEARYWPEIWGHVPGRGWRDYPIENDALHRGDNFVLVPQPDGTLLALQATTSPAGHEYMWERSFRSEEGFSAPVMRWNGKPGHWTGFVVRENDVFFWAFRDTHPDAEETWMWHRQATDGSWKELGVVTSADVPCHWRGVAGRVVGICRGPDAIVYRVLEKDGSWHEMDSSLPSWLILSAEPRGSRLWLYLQDDANRTYEVLVDVEDPAAGSPARLQAIEFAPFDYRHWDADGHLLYADARSTMVEIGGRTYWESQVGVTSLRPGRTELACPEHILYDPAVTLRADWSSAPLPDGKRVLLSEWCYKTPDDGACRGRLSLHIVDMVHLDAP